MTTRDSVAHLRKQFQRLDANLLGVVINGATRTADLYGYYAETETSPGMRGLLGPLGRRRTPA
jgi:hypothetical protein